MAAAEDAAAPAVQLHGLVRQATGHRLASSPPSWPTVGCSTPLLPAASAAPGHRLAGRATLSPPTVPWDSCLPVLASAMYPRLQQRDRGDAAAMRTPGTTPVVGVGAIMAAARLLTLVVVQEAATPAVSMPVRLVAVA